MTIWEELKYFSSSENWGSPEKMNHDFLRMLDKFRSILGLPFFINCGFARSGHSAKSQHYQGRAVDGYAKTDLLSLYLAAESAGFNGIGLYPEANTPFIHVDNRILLDSEKKARWIAIKKESDWDYIGFSSDNFRKYII